MRPLRFPSSVRSWFYSSCLTLLALMACVVPAHAERSAVWRGHTVTQRSYIFGTISYVGELSAKVNMGFGHGLKEGHQLLVVRAVGETMLPVAAVTVRSTNGGDATLDLEGPFQIQVGDVALIRASTLDLWSERDRQEDLLLQRVLRRESTNGWNSLDVAPGLVNEVARDDEQRRTMLRGKQTETYTREASERSRLTTLPSGAITGLVHVDPTHPNESIPQAEQDDDKLMAINGLIQAVSSEEAMIERLTTARLSALPKSRRQPDVTNNTAVALRRLLFSWSKKILAPIPAN